METPSEPGVDAVEQEWDDSELLEADTDLPAGQRILRDGLLLVLVLAGCAAILVWMD